MAYSNKYGNRPFEFASKSSHSNIVKDKEINAYLTDCQLPKNSDEIIHSDLINKISKIDYVQDDQNPIQYVIAIDCGHTTVIAKQSFPSTQIAILQFGTLLLNLEDLKTINQQLFVSPKEMSRLKKIGGFKLILPVSNIKYKGEASLLSSIRTTIFDFLQKTNLLTTLKWLLYQEYNNPKDKIQLNACPNCQVKNIELPLNKDEINCSKCGERLHLVDFLRLHELIDEDHGAKPIVRVVTTLIEQLMLIDYLRLFSIKHPDYFQQTLFLIDGSLAFFGQISILHKHTRDLINFLQLKHTMFLASLEKSGAFVEHAMELCKIPNIKITNSHVFLPDNDYICKYIVAKKNDSQKPYGSSTYYGLKIIFKDSHSKIHVVNIPVSNNKIILNPKLSDLSNLNNILTIIDKLKCDMYDNALLPIAIINKAVSLAHNPSSIILKKFAKQKMA